LDRDDIENDSGGEDLSEKNDEFNSGIMQKKNH